MCQRTLISNPGVKFLDKFMQRPAFQCVLCGEMTDRPGEHDCPEMAKLVITSADEPRAYTALDYQEGLGRLAGAIQYLARRRRLDDGIAGVELTPRMLLDQAYEMTYEAAMGYDNDKLVEGMIAYNALYRATVQILDSARRDH